MVINLKIAKIFKKLISKFDSDDFRVLGCEGQYAYATDGHIILVYKMSDDEWCSRPVGFEDTFCVDYADLKEMQKAGDYAAVAVHTPDELGYKRIFTLDNMWLAVGGKTKLLEAAKNGEPAVGFRFNWEMMACLGAPEDWVCFAYPMWNNQPACTLMMHRHRKDLFAVVTPYRSVVENDAFGNLKAMIGE